MAELIIFPQSRNVGKARHVAELYWSKVNPKEREIYWRMVVSRLAAARCMAKCGFSQPAIDQQINSFRFAVQDQLDALPSRATEMEAANGQQRQSAFELDRRPS